MRGPLLSEDQHRHFLSMLLDEIVLEGIKPSSPTFQVIAPLARDNLSIARKVGYVALYEEFKPLYKRAGL